MANQKNPNAEKDYEDVDPQVALNEYQQLEANVVRINANMTRLMEQSRNSREELELLFQKLEIRIAFQQFEIMALVGQKRCGNTAAIFLRLWNLAKLQNQSYNAMSTINKLARLEAHFKFRFRKSVRFLEVIRQARRALLAHMRGRPANQKHFMCRRKKNP